MIAVISNDRPQRSIFFLIPRPRMGLVNSSNVHRAYFCSLIVIIYGRLYRARRIPVHRLCVALFIIAMTDLAPGDMGYLYGENQVVRDREEKRTFSIM